MAERNEARPRMEEASAPMWAAKSGLTLKLILLFLVPYFYLVFFQYKMEPELRRSILINAGLSLAAFFVTIKMIPVAVPYLLRHTSWGYNINTRGTPRGFVRVSEPLGLVGGIVFMVFSILFLYFNLDSNVLACCFSFLWRYLFNCVVVTDFWSASWLNGQ